MGSWEACPFRSQLCCAPQVVSVGAHWQPTNLPLHVALPFESNVPAHPFRSQLWGFPHCVLCGRHWQPANLPLQVAFPSESKVPAQLRNARSGQFLCRSNLKVLVLIKAKRLARSNRSSGGSHKYRHCPASACIGSPQTYPCTWPRRCCQTCRRNCGLACQPIDQ